MKRLLTSLLLISLLSGFAITHQAHALNRGELETQIRRRANDIDEDIWSDTILDEMIELAQIAIVRETWCLYSTAVDTVTEGTSEYVLSNDCLEVVRVSIENASTDGQYDKLESISVRKLDKKFPGWEGASNSRPAYYYRRRNRIGIYPPPNSNYAGHEKLKVDYIEFPDSFADDNAIPFNSRRRLYPYHDLIIWYVLELCFLDQGMLNKAAYYGSKYTRGVNDMRGQINIKPDRQSYITMGDE